MIGEFWRLTIAVIRIEFAKTFFARRSLWIYLLALLPPTLFYVNSIYSGRENRRLAAVAAEHPIPKENLRLIRPGLSEERVVERLGEPYRKLSRKFWMGRPPLQHDRSTYFYTDGQTDFMMIFADGTLQGISRRGGQGLPQLLLVFATVFQLYFIRLAIFFGCAGIFSNLFRGEMLDKSLHFYLLSPLPRPALVAGKYIAGLLATALIFSASTALQFYAMLRGFDSASVSQYLKSGGWDQIAAYMSIAALACVIYGSIFLAAGLFSKNPAVPAALILLWESVNAFIPGTLKMASVVFYLQSLSPIEAMPDQNLPPLLRSLLAPAERVEILTSIGVILALTALVLVFSSVHTRKLEINYSSD
jgi:ABC-type transport system involved in multi-copper enzyme maturation permease subunit